MPPIIQKRGNKIPNDPPDTCSFILKLHYGETLCFFYDIDFCDQQMTQTCLSLFPAGLYFLIK